MRAGELVVTLEQPNRTLRGIVDSAAGTTELSILVDLCEQDADVYRALKLRDLLERVKGLKKHVDQAVGEMMEEVFSSDLTAAVMTWYERIRTIGDPDVHFSGFSMEKTKTGEFKNRRVKVSAQSYGVQLASAVSSLSESKLNALGLCVSIATTLKAPGPWRFLVLDDPIQSWDEEHETQFMDVIRTLVEDENRQIILLSHRENWIGSCADTCRSLNGKRYRITAYQKDGPQVAELEWATTRQRLREALMISNDSGASPVRLQQGEAEIRTAAGQIIAEIARKKLGRTTSANMNGDRAREILISVGCPSRLVDRVFATYSTTDDAHHAPEDYQACRERIRRHHSTLVELGKAFGAPA